MNIGLSTNDVADTNNQWSLKKVTRTKARVIRKYDDNDNSRKYKRIHPKTTDPKSV